MSKYFTKEYIELTKDKRIQKLRPLEMFGNFYINRFNEIKVIWQRRYRNKAVKIFMPNIKIWLPTGDQLDEEIVKICNKNGFQYETFYAGNYVFCVEGQAKTYGKNPLIAKIKLLKQLLK